MRSQRKSGSTAAQAVNTALRDRDNDPLWESKEARNDKREKKRSAIVSCASVLFVERGYERTAIEDVASALGVTKATIYHYYVSKEELLMACLMRGLDAFEGALREAAASPGTGAERLWRMLHGYGLVAAATEGRVVMTVQGYDLLPENQKALRAIKRRCGRMLKRTIEEGIQDKSIRPMNVTVCMYALTGALNWLSEWFDPDSELDDAAVVSNMLDLFFNGIRNS